MFLLMLKSRERERLKWREKRCQCWRRGMSVKDLEKKERASVEKEIEEKKEIERGKHMNGFKI